MVDFGVHHLPLPGGAPAPKIRGSLSPPAALSRGTLLRRARGGHARRSLALPQPRREIRVVPPLMRRFGEVLDHNGEAPPSERKALGLRKSWNRVANTLTL